VTISPLAPGEVRLDVAKMLREGATTQEVMQTLKVGRRTVMRHREALDIPAPRRTGTGGAPTESLENAFYARVKSLPDGHMRWEGSFEGTKPRVRWGGKDGPRMSARRAAFLLHHGREVRGLAVPVCGDAQCIAPAHTGEKPFTSGVSAAAQLAAIKEWVTSDVVTAKTEFGDGYRECQRDLRDKLGIQPEENT
jgi:hypothetical protein